MVELIEEEKNPLEGRLKYLPPPPTQHRPIPGGYNTEIAKITSLK